MKSVLRAIVVALGLFCVSSAYAEESGIPQFQGRAKIGDKNLHYSYFFLPRLGKVVEFDYGPGGEVASIGHGNYSMGKDQRLTIRWESGAKEIGKFSGNKYTIIDHEDPAQVGVITHGRWSYLAEADRAEELETYVRTVIVPLSRTKATIARMTAELEVESFKTHQKIIEMWLK